MTAASWKPSFGCLARQWANRPGFPRGTPARFAATFGIGTKRTGTKTKPSLSRTGGTNPTTHTTGTCDPGRPVGREKPPPEQQLGADGSRHLGLPEHPHGSSGTEARAVLQPLLGSL